ncbi:hypothetical protein OSSY52_18370 [Tepiditoga spiralis]|uniref:SPOR domain-containing protein n=1 Tax=Tepiditoga spiralis TaxID=2108365 RepID=A0A7G1G8F7_9BACT|nr:hypothetical protein [Tepiditoga spiralis]BBE31696.1 hypothetical protein OSSY52_18370 [Tepiditoga spiralis]
MDKNSFLKITIVLVFILPLITLLLTVYTIYLKVQIKDLSISINDLKTNVIKEEITSNLKENITLPEINPKKTNLKYEIKELNFENLLNGSSGSLKLYNLGAVKVFNDKIKAFSKAVEAYEKNINYYIFMYKDKYYLYRRDYKLINSDDYKIVDEKQYIYTVQLRYFASDQAQAFVTATTLKKAGFPAFIMTRNYANSTEKNFTLLSGLFFEKKEAEDYMNNINETEIKDLIGLSVKDRFIRGIYFSGEKN